MMIWCELHNSSTLKAGITNFDMSEYEKEIGLLNNLTQASRTLKSRECLSSRWFTAVGRQQ